jgi:hypothetical protein
MVQRLLLGGFIAKESKEDRLCPQRKEVELRPSPTSWLLHPGPEYRRIQVLSTETKGQQDLAAVHGVLL